MHIAQSLIKLADTYGPGVDWAEPGPEEVNPMSPLAVAAYLKKNPTNFWARQTLTLRFIEQEKWAEAAESAK